MSSSLTNGLVVVVAGFGQCFHRASHFNVNESYVKYVVYDEKSIGEKRGETRMFNDARHMSTCGFVQCIGRNTART
jgi:hypothetical protein